MGDNMKKAFTLAEVLITLGIIGIVAAMTLPTLIQDYKKKVVETRLAHFYTVINQAIRLSEVENGDKAYWFENAGGWNEDRTENAKLVWMQKYILPYMNGVRCVMHDGMYADLPVCYLPNGGAFASYNTSTINRDWIYWPGDPMKCAPSLQDNVGTCSFAFYYNPHSTRNNPSNNSSKNCIEPWKLGWDGTKEMLYRECQNTSESYDRPCAAIIQYHGWRIPDDYPYQVRY